MADHLTHLTHLTHHTHHPAAASPSHHLAPPVSGESFLNTILNPALGYAQPFHLLHANQMPPTTRAARLPSGYVDLTATPDSPPQRRKRQSPTPGPSAKRQKRDSASTVEEVDLTDEKPRPHATKSHAKPDEKPTTFNTFNCVICMDMPTDLTATACGHLFCHTCLMEALIAGENRSAPGDPRRSQCPVCRKFINRNKPTDIIPLLLKKGLATQPRKKAMPSPSAVAPKVH